MAQNDVKLLEALQRIAKAIEAIARKTDPEFTTRHQRQIDSMRRTRRKRAEERSKQR